MQRVEFCAADKSALARVQALEGTLRNLATDL